MILTALALASLAAPSEPAAVRAPAPAPVERVYRVLQTARLTQVSEDAHEVRWWISIPGDDRFQDVLDLEVVSAPGPWRLEREAEHGNLFLRVDALDPQAETLEAVVAFTLRRQEVQSAIDPERVGPLTDTHRRLFAAECRRDAPHMEVTPELQAIADRVCGDQQNPALERAALLAWVAAEADHYSKDPTKPACGVGDAGDCLVNKGGCCTDLSSLYIALARARGIPSRLQMGYRLLEKNEGREVDPGYRCWVESFLPGYGWVAADIVEADAGAEGRAAEYWFQGLSERRLWLNQGRDFALDGAASRVNHMSLGYAEVDGEAVTPLPRSELAPRLTRSVRFEEVGPEDTARTAARDGSSEREQG